MNLVLNSRFALNTDRVTSYIQGRHGDTMVLHFREHDIDLSQVNITHARGWLEGFMDGVPDNDEDLFATFILAAGDQYADGDEVAEALVAGVLLGWDGKRP